MQRARIFVGGVIKKEELFNAKQSTIFQDALEFVQSRLR